MRLRLLFALVSIIGLYALPAAAVPVVSIESPALAVSAGQSVSLDISVRDVADLYAFEFDLSFDPAVLLADGIVEGAFLATGGATFFVPGAIDNAAGTIASTAGSLLGPVPGVNGSGILATVAFTAQGVGTSQITSFGITLLDSSLSVISATTENGSVEVTPVVPAPPTWMLLGAGLLGVELWRRYRAA